MLGTSAETVVIPASCTIGSSSTNTSTFNAIPNFVNGFSCAGGNSFKLYCGTATYVDGSVNINNSNNTSIVPQVNYGGTGIATYTLDQTISSTISGVGCFVNCPNYNFVFWYYYQSSTTTIVAAFSNLSTSTQTLPTSISYICFA
jgi:hypothetical protein